MKKTSRVIFMVMLLLAATAAKAQSFASDSTARRQSVYLELGAGSNGIGLNYERRLKKDPHWGWRAGLSWGYNDSSMLSIMSTSERIYSGSLGMNYLLGKGRSKLELGAGLSAGLYNSHFSWGSDYKAKENNFGWYAYGNIGYRYQARSGFQFRCGWSPVTGFGTKHGVVGDSKVIYLSVGWSF